MDEGGDPHSHSIKGDEFDSSEKAITTVVVVLGVVSNVALLVAIAAQRHTRRLASTFLVHAALLNIAACLLAAAFGGAPGFGRLAANSCNFLGVCYIVVTTNSAFNLAAEACCEVYLLRPGVKRRRRRSEATVSCVLFGLLCLHFSAVLLHMGPTIVGAHFRPSEPHGRCHLVYRQGKNYIVYASWILMVSVALAAAAQYLVLLGRAIADAFPGVVANADSGDATLRRLAGLSGAKRGRRRALWAVCCLHAVCWLPLFCLLLMDSNFAAGRQLYQVFTTVFFAKASLEPLVMLAMDTGVGVLTLLGRNPDGRVVEDELESLLQATSVRKYEGDYTVGSRLSSHAPASVHELQPLAAERHRQATPSLGWSTA